MCEAHCDIVVVGSGAAGLSAAVTAAHFGLRVIVVEKHCHIGGTTAWSGGWLWIPRNDLAVSAGIREQIEAPLEYLQSEIGDMAKSPRMLTFLEKGPQMVRFFRDHTAVEWIDGNRIPDFHASSKGASEGGRSVCAAPYDGRNLGKWASKLRPPLDVASLWGMGIASGQDMAHFFNATKKWRSALHVTRRITRHFVDLAINGRASQLVNGNALVARLLRSALDLGVEFRVNSSAEQLIKSEARIAGVRANGQKILASRGVVLATGGFPHDTVRMQSMFDHVQAGFCHYSAAPQQNTGDGLKLAEAENAKFCNDLAEPAAWAPVSLLPRNGGFAHFPHLVDRAKPGFIAVANDGTRFVNEADSYHDFMKALFAKSMQEPFAWIIGDAKAVRQFGIGAVKPFPFPLGKTLRSGYLKRGNTVAALAREINVPSDALADTIENFNRHARLGEDPDFNRGRSAYNRIQGDPDNFPNPSLRPLETPPFYAVKIVPGSLGTFAGLLTDENARVLDRSGNVIPGLYAAGNDAASIMNGNYPAGGITLGPAMTFGYIAGQHLAMHPPSKQETAKEMGHAVL